jgi:hypothetical protein
MGVVGGVENVPNFPKRRRIGNSTIHRCLNILHARVFNDGFFVEAQVRLFPIAAEVDDRLDAETRKLSERFFIRLSGKVNFVIEDRSFRRILDRERIWTPIVWDRGCP